MLTITIQLNLFSCHQVRKRIIRGRRRYRLRATQTVRYARNTKCGPSAVTLIVNEQEETVTSVQCHDCPSSEGGYKHGVAFLMWLHLHRRTEAPSCTSIECYWSKSNLAKVGSLIKMLCKYKRNL